MIAVLAAAPAACRSSQALDMTDEGIKARIQANLEADKELDLRYVTLNVHDKIATISGMVPTWNDTMRVRRIVEGTKGVDQALINLVTQD